MVVKFPNGKVVYIACSTKTGSTSATSILGYPRTGKHIARQMKSVLARHKEYWGRMSKSPYNYNTVDFKCAIIRDPVERLVSCFKDRVLLKNREDMKSEIVEWSTLLENLEYFRSKYRDFRVHSDPQVYKIGIDPNFYDKVYYTSEISSRFLVDMSDIAECEIPPIRTKVSDDAKQEIIVTDEDRKVIKDFYKKDYRYWGQYF